MARRKGSGIISLRFNQDQGCFTCCMDTGLRVYNVEPLVEKAHYTTEEIGDVVLCEMLQRSNMLLLVRGSRPRCLLAFDAAANAVAAEVSFRAHIRAIRIRKDRLVVVLDRSVHILSWPGLVRLALLQVPSSGGEDAAPGGGGTVPIDIATANNAPHPLLVAPAHRVGSVQILDLSTVRVGASATPATLRCHRARVACVALSPSGALLCTASARGTLLRVWDAPKARPLMELRRGAEQASLYCISFSACGELLCCASDKGTLHVWALRERGRNRRSALAPAAAALGLGQSAAAPHALATARLHAPDTRAHCALLSDTNIVAICEDGSYHKFVLSADGQCRRDSQEDFLQVGDDDDFLV